MQKRARTSNVGLFTATKPVYPPRSIRDGDWKLVAAQGDPWERYDLKTDRAEQHNLGAQMPDKAKELEQAWQQQTNSFTELAKKTLADQPKGKAGKGKKVKK